MQNMAALLAYQNLDALTFNVLNQTKTLSAALNCYWLLGRSQSPLQMVALVLLLVSALVMEGIIPIQVWLGLEDAAKDSSKEFQSSHLYFGVIPILTASFISGLAGALTQRSLQGAGGRNSYLFSMELCAATSIMVSSSLTMSMDGGLISEYGYWHNWTSATWIPIATGAAGGVLVGLVTKYAGSVRKGFALIFGMFLSGVLQSVVAQQGVSVNQMVGGAVAGISLYLHATNPPQTPVAPVKQE